MRVGHSSFHDYTPKPFQDAQRDAAGNAMDFGSFIQPQGGADQSNDTALSSSGQDWMIEGGRDVDAGNSVAAKFLDWMQMDPIQRLRAQILESMGLDEASLDALPPEEKKAIEAEISDAIQRTFGVGDEANALDAEKDAASDPTIAA